MRSPVWRKTVVRHDRKSREVISGLVPGNECEEIMTVSVSHKSMTTSRVGWEQQTRTLPSAGLSSGSGL